MKRAVLLYIVISISLNYAYSQANAGPDQVLCTDETVLQADNPALIGGTGIWSVVSGQGTFLNPDEYNTPVSNIGQGDNIYRWEVTVGFDVYTDDVTIINNSVQATASDQSGCNSSFILNGNDPSVFGGEGIWALIGGSGNLSNSTLYNSTVTGIPNGSTSTLKWTVNNGICFDDKEISVSNHDFSVSAGINQVLCNSSTVLAGDEPGIGNTGSSGYWYVVAGGAKITNSAQFNTPITGLTPGNNTFRWVVSSPSCTAFDEVMITNNNPTTATIVLPLAEDRDVCTGSVTVQGIEPVFGNGQWTINAGGAFTNISDPTNFQTDINNIHPGDNIIRWTITNEACVSSNDITITNNEVASRAGSDQSICNDNTFLNATDPNVMYPFQGIGMWSNLSGNEAIIVNSLSEVSQITDMPVGITTFQWTVKQGDCIATDNVEIVNHSVVANASDVSTCTSDAVLTGNNPAPGETGIWTSFTPGVTFDSQTSYITAVHNLNIGNNIFEWTVSNSLCTSSAIINAEYLLPVAIVGDSIFTCGTEAYLNGNEPGMGEAGVWTVISSSGIFTNPSLFNTQVTNLSLGVNIFRWTITNGTCSDYADLVVTNNKYNAFASIAGPTTICVDSAELIGNIPIAGSTGMWSITAGTGLFDDPTDPTARVYDLSVGENTLKWTVTKYGCDNSDDVSITNNMVTATAGSDIITCGNDPTLSAGNLQGGESGLWTRLSGGAIIVSPSIENTLVTGLSPGVNRFRWTVTGSGIGCIDQDEVHVYENSFTISAGFNKSVCSSETTLQGEDPSPGTGIWTFPGPLVTIVDPTLNTSTVNGLQDNSAHTFRWTVSRNGCQAYDEVVITNNLVHAYAGNDLTTCNSNVILNGGDPSQGTGYWTISTGAGFVTDPTYSKSSVTGLGLGINILNWTVTNKTCADVDQVVVSNNTVTALAGIDQAICDDKTFLAGDPPQNEGYGIWTLAGGAGSTIQNPTLFNSYVSNLQRGINTFRWTVFENGCDNGGDLVRIVNNTFDAYAGEDQILPAGLTQTNFAATLLTGGIGQWSILAGGGNITILDDPTTFVNNLPTGESIFSWAVNMPTGCSDTDEVSITAAAFDPIPGPNQVVCVDTAIMNAVSEPGAINQYWDIVAGGGVFDNINDPKTTVRKIPVGINVYRWNVSYPGYTSSDVVQVTNDSIHVSAGNDAVLCLDYHQLYAQQIIGGIGRWTFVSGGGTIASNTLYNTVITDINQGTNQFEWRTFNGNCESRDTVAITYNLPPIAEFSVDQEIFTAPTEVVLTNLSDYYAAYTMPDSFVWSIIEPVEKLGYTIDLSSNVYHTFTNIGSEDSVYVIELIAYDYQTTCSDTVTHSVTAHPQPESINEIDSEFKISPNPTNGIVRISSTDNLSDAVVKLIDMSGKEFNCYIRKKEHNELQLDLTNLAKGIYFIKVYSRGKIKLLKVMKK